MAEKPAANTVGRDETRRGGKRPPIFPSQQNWSGDKKDKQKKK